jgi:hypothetical protein
MGRRYHFTESRRERANWMNRRVETSKHDLRTARYAEKFFALGKNFPENMLHKFNNFVQLPTSDIGFRAFHLTIDR